MPWHTHYRGWVIEPQDGGFFCSGFGQGGNHFVQGNIGRVIEYLDNVCRDDEKTKSLTDYDALDEWIIIDTPCFPNRYKLVRIGGREDNDPSNFFPTLEATRAEAYRRGQASKLPQLPSGYYWRDVNYDAKHASVIYPDHQEDRHTFTEWSSYLADASKGRYVSELSFQIEGLDCYPVKPMCGSGWQFVCPQINRDRHFDTVEKLRPFIRECIEEIPNEDPYFHTTVEDVIEALERAAHAHSHAGGGGSGGSYLSMFLASDAKADLLQHAGKTPIIIKP